MPPTARRGRAARAGGRPFSPVDMGLQMTQTQFQLRLPPDKPVVPVHGREHPHHPCAQSSRSPATWAGGAWWSLGGGAGMELGHPHTQWSQSKRSRPGHLQWADERDVIGCTHHLTMTCIRSARSDPWNYRLDSALGLGKSALDVAPMQSRMRSRGSVPGHATCPPVFSESDQPTRPLPAEGSSFT